MARTARWKKIDFSDNVYVTELSSWKYFSDFVNKELLDYTTYVYRGHAVSAWKLEPTLDRIINSPTSVKRDEHLTRFKLETRGRRGPNPAILKEENDWWALGQHHGLATPLLDWTESPFVALFFAMSNAIELNSKEVTVYALSQAAINAKNKMINKNNDIELINKQKPTVKIVRPLSDENSRLVSQRGLFTRGPNNIDLESWIRNHKVSGRERRMDLMKINIPVAEQDINHALRYLNRMNINNSTLFPDLSGASEYCNLHLKISSY
ncbi:FRG domain-containing protein [Aeromonas jandaei]|uniref:FRG domain-containing protein n=1 Tax=Aeromonas jandaei TaxID=650 RepID=A0A7T4A7L0_AERJA|nr:FRG domain-containing protein [Aeromonas jandaei]QQB18796.1 FRG domain-containing protein [Aeromonas jandaei]UCA33468.1 FRG domain-containing protein [Aeromonas jandaei]